MTGTDVDGRLGAFFGTGGGGGGGGGGGVAGFFTTTGLGCRLFEIWMMKYGTTISSPLPEAASA